MSFPGLIREQLSGKGEICETLLRSLPQWFGIEKAIVEYTRMAESLPMLVAELGGQIIGFVSIEFHNAHTAEIHVMAVREEHHRSGAGRALVSAAETLARKRGASFLMVKTLGPSRKHEPYARTREFYLGVRFLPLHESLTIWGEQNPCLLLAKNLQLPPRVHKHPPVLRTARLVLRLAEERDVPAIARFYRENEAHFALTDPARPEGFYTEPYWSDRVKQSLEEFKAEQSLRFFLFEAENDSVIVGTASFTQMSRGPLHGCSLGYGISSAHQGQGLMNEALTAAIDHVFNQMQFHRIEAGYLPENERSARVLKRLGFVIEGKASNYLLINGQWRDHVLTALTNPNWKAPQIH
jgi:ribosomal-protein-alanine N-acetyltransferase